MVQGNFINAAKAVEESSVFVEWKKDHEKAFLSTGFVGEAWLVTYYDPDTDKMYSFQYDGSVSFHQEDAVLKKEGASILPVVLSDIVVHYDRVCALISDHTRDKGNTVKQLYIIQNLHDFGLVWNVTCVFEGMRLLNVKISAKDGSILSKTEENLMDMMRMEKGERNDENTSH